MIFPLQVNCCTLHNPFLSRQSHPKQYLKRTSSRGRPFQRGSANLAVRLGWQAYLSGSKTVTVFTSWRVSLSSKLAFSSFQLKIFNLKLKTPIWMTLSCRWSTFRVTSWFRSCTQRHKSECLLVSFSQCQVTSPQSVNATCTAAVAMTVSNQEHQLQKLKMLVCLFFFVLTFLLCACSISIL